MMNLTADRFATILKDAALDYASLEFQSRWPCHHEALLTKDFGYFNSSSECICVYYQFAACDDAGIRYLINVTPEMNTTWEIIAWHLTAVCADSSCTTNLVIKHCAPSQLIAIIVKMQQLLRTMFEAGLIPYYYEASA